MSSFLYKNKVLALVQKKYEEIDIKVFRSCLTMLDFLIFAKIFEQECRNHKICWNNQATLVSNKYIFTFLEQDKLNDYTKDLFFLS